MVSITFRPSTASDVLAFYNKRPSNSMKAITALIDDIPVAIAGINFYEDFVGVFRKTKEDPAKYPIATYKLAMYVMKMVKEIKGPVFARPDPDVEKAVPFLLYLGFECIDKDKEIYQWTP